MTKNHLSDVQDLLRLESNAIAQTATRLDAAQVERVVDLIADCKGKVVILGVGKSGIIGQKIAATMTSTGTAAFYLHPSDALHGGLGIVQPDDVVIVLSNSGETDEIVGMLPYLKNRQVAIVAIVGNLNSTLANRADAVLSGTVISVTFNPTVFDPANGRASVAEVHLALQLNLVERSTGKVLYSRPRIDAKESYQISPDPAQYFDESDAALERASRQLANQVVTSILENF